MLYFLTEYQVGNRKYSSHVFASDIDAATTIAERRGLGERVLSAGSDFNEYPYVLTSTLIEQWASMGTDASLTTGTAAAAMHAACNLCHFAVASGVLSLDGALGDMGLVHGLAHAAAKDESADMIALALMARRIEESVPGLLPAQPIRTVSAAAERIVELEASQRRAIKLVERLLPYVRWDGLDGEDEEWHARTTLAILREKVEI